MGEFPPLALKFPRKRLARRVVFVSFDCELSTSPKLSDWPHLQALQDDDNAVKYSIIILELIKES